MKNLHIIPTDKPSRLYSDCNSKLQLASIPYNQGALLGCVNQNICITAEEDIEKDDWVVCWEDGYKKIQVVKLTEDYYTPWVIRSENYKKVILTNDPELIEDGIQAINDESLNWLAKNLSCEFVEVKKECLSNDGVCKEVLLPSEWEAGIKVIHKIIIPKAETIEEAARKFAATNSNDLQYQRGGFIEEGIDDEQFANKLVEFTKYWIANLKK